MMTKECFRNVAFLSVFAIVFVCVSLIVFASVLVWLVFAFFFTFMFVFILIFVKEKGKLCIKWLLAVVTPGSKKKERMGRLVLLCSRLGCSAHLSRTSTTWVG